jgi:hypothetical protein
VPYAAFDASRRIDPARFLPFDRGATGLDSQRRVIGRTLQLLSRGQVDGFQERGLQFVSPALVTAIQALVRIQSHLAAPCSDPAKGTEVAFAISGHFFNTNPAAPIPGDATNDVVASVRAIRRSGDPSDGLLRLESLVERCTSADCSARSVLLAPAVFGTVGEEHAFSLTLAWDPANDRFIAQRDFAPEVARGYAVSDSSAPGVASKALYASHRNGCPDGELRTSHIEVRVENVAANEGAL